MTDKRTFAIGDIHGRLDLLERLIPVILERCPDPRLIFLGDYVDRGQDSRGVVEFLMHAPERLGVQIECLKGNHEQMMLNACRTRASRHVDRWLDNGGYEAMLSYGWSGRRTPDLSLVPESHLAWIEALPFIATDAHRIYVHAGVRPGVPLSEQVERDCLWIRERFLGAGDDELPGHVVHGHTPSWLGKPDPAAPELLRRRTNLDTMAYGTDVLSIGVFDPDRPGGPLEILATGPSRLSEDTGLSPEPRRA